jgi:hypothetical protein
MRDLIANLMQLDDVNRLIGEIMRGLSRNTISGHQLRSGA